LACLRTITQKIQLNLYNSNVNSKTTNKIPYIFFAGPAVSLAISPFVTFDVLNPPKLLMLSLFGGLALGLLISNRQKILSKTFSPIFYISLLFLVCLISSFLFSGGNQTTQLYGVHGRHTGLIAYFSLCFLLLAVSLNATLLNIKYALGTMFFTGVVSFSYAFLQLIDLDPLPWKGNETWIVGTFANPNFFSSFVAIVNILSFTYILQESLSTKQRIFAVLPLIFGVYLLSKIGSTQGFIVLFVGVSFTFLIRVKNSKRFNKTFYPLGVFTIVIVVFVVLDILQRAPWESKLYKLSVAARGDYWRAAIQIMNDYPWTGVGIDGFRNWYPKYRDWNSLNHGEASTLADAVHNVFLDFGVNGGIFLFLSYVSIVFLALIAAIRIIKRMQSFDAAIVSLTAVWLGYQAQSLISINQLSLAIWGWIFSGLIIGYEIHSRPTTNIESNLNNTKNPTKKSSRKYRNTKKSYFWAPPLIGAILGFSLVWPLMSAHINYNTAMKNADPVSLLNAANQYPKDALRMSMAAESVSLMGFPRDGYDLAKKASVFDPNFSVPWKIMATFPRVSEEEKKQIQEKLNELDPLFNEAEKRRLALK